VCLNKKQLVLLLGIYKKKLLLQVKKWYSIIELIQQTRKNWIVIFISIDLCL
jgi:hypothetical protein